MATQAEIETDIIEGALSDLNVIAANETPSAEDSQRGGDYLDQIIEELRTKDEVTFGDIPVWAIRPLRQMLAGDLAISYAVPNEVRNGAFVLARTGLRSLRGQYTERKNINDPVQVMDF